MRVELREKAIKLRVEKNYSYSQIKKELGVPKGTLSYWLKDYPLTPERITELRKEGWTNSEASRERFRSTMRAIKSNKEELVFAEYITKFSKISTQTSFCAGLMLYLAEGDKRNKNRICLANSDPKLLIFFIRWLERHMDVERPKIKVQAHLYENMDIAEELKYWREMLLLDETQFYKPSIRKLKEGSFTYDESYGHGTCSLYVLDTMKKTELRMAIRAFLEQVKKI